MAMSWLAFCSSGTGWEGRRTSGSYSEELSVDAAVWRSACPWPWHFVCCYQAQGEWCTRAHLVVHEISSWSP